MSQEPPKSELILYRTEDGASRIEVRFEGDTAWLSLSQLADLFQRDKSVISRHLRNIFEEGELSPEATVAEYATVQPEGARQVLRSIEYYNLAAVLAVGYRVKSPRGMQFRQWASARLSEYMVKGFALDDARLKAGGGGLYFDELLERIRDIRSSEKVFWRKVLEIYATSVDYDPHAEMSALFFKTVQNKMHWAAHGHTAAEVVVERADAEKPNMGLTSWAGARPRKGDASIAKNYLDAEELDALNRIVALYLDFAELQAKNRRAMTMRDWIAKLDDFLRISEREILTHAGKVSHDVALLKAETEYTKFEKKWLAEPTRAELDFEEAAERLKRLPSARRRAGKPKGRGD